MTCNVILTAIKVVWQALISNNSGEKALTTEQFLSDNFNSEAFINEGRTTLSGGGLTLVGLSLWPVKALPPVATTYSI